MVSELPHNPDLTVRKASSLPIDRDAVSAIHFLFSASQSFGAAVLTRRHFHLSVRLIVINGYKHAYQGLHPPNATRSAVATAAKSACIASLLTSEFCRDASEALKTLF